jgi:hypothetical protein
MKYESGRALLIPEDRARAPLSSHTPTSRRAGNSIENQSDHSDGRQIENHARRDRRRYETRNANAKNSIRQI